MPARPLGCALALLLLLSRNAAVRDQAAPAAPSEGDGPRGGERPRNDAVAAAAGADDAHAGAGPPPAPVVDTVADSEEEEVVDDVAHREDALREQMAVADQAQDALRKVMVETIRSAVGHIQYPVKARVEDVAKMLGRRHQRHFKGYKFITRGGLFSPYVRHVTDIDMIFNKKERGLISLGDFDALERVASDLFKGFERITTAKVVHDDEVRFDGPVEDLGAVRAEVEKGADVVVLSGQYELSSSHNGWRIPMDVTLQRGESRMSKQDRFGKIRQNLEEANFAKVCSRMRALLLKEKKKTFGFSWSDAGGRIRFLVKQLELLRGMPEWQASKYIEEKLLLPSDPTHEEWEAVAQDEMQRIALVFLLQRRPLYAEMLRRLAPDILATIEAAGKARSTAASD